jgi:hypothetical protein
MDYFHAQRSGEGDEVEALRDMSDGDDDDNDDDGGGDGDAGNGRGGATAAVLSPPTGLLQSREV